MRPMAMGYFKEKYNKCNRLHFIDKKLQLHCGQNKDRLLPSGELFFNLNILYIPTVKQGFDI
jgi:hypothetical protein